MQSYSLTHASLPSLFAHNNRPQPRCIAKPKRDSKPNCNISSQLYSSASAILLSRIRLLIHLCHFSAYFTHFQPSSVLTATDCNTTPTQLHPYLTNCNSPTLQFFSRTLSVFNPRCALRATATPATQPQPKSRAHSRCTAPDFGCTPTHLSCMVIHFSCTVTQLDCTLHCNPLRLHTNPLCNNNPCNHSKR